MRPIFYIYIYRDPSREDEPIYVGKGTGRRARTHLERKDNSPFSNRLSVMKRNGVKPSIEIIQAVDESHAFFMEECRISVIGRKDLRKGPLLNLTDGGGGASGHICSEDHKKKISMALTGITRSEESKEKNRIAHLGIKQSKESRIARSKRQKGRPGAPQSNGTREKLRFLNLGQKKYTCSCLSCKKEISVQNLSRHIDSAACSYKPKYRQPICSCLVCKALMPVNGLQAHQKSLKCN